VLIKLFLKEKTIPLAGYLSSFLMIMEFMLIYDLNLFRIDLPFKTI
jgi:hypothetical protein